MIENILHLDYKREQTSQTDQIRFDIICYLGCYEKTSFKIFPKK